MMVICYMLLDSISWPTILFFFVLSFSSFYNKVIKMNHIALALFIVSGILFITYCLTKKICKNLPINLV